MRRNAEASTHRPETLIARRQHWAVADSAGGYLVAAVLCALVPPVPAIAPIIFASCALLAAACSLAKAWAARIEVGNGSVQVTSGILWKATAQMPISSIEGVVIYQSPVGRWLDFGGITITGLGGRTLHFGPVQSPNELQETIQTEMTKIGRMI